MKYKLLRSLVAVVLVFVLLFNMSPIKAHASTLVGVLSGAASAVGVGGIWVVAAILVGLGVYALLDYTDFWQLAQDILDALPKRYTFTSAQVNEVLLQVMKYDDSYYVSSDLVEAVNDYVFTGTVDDSIPATSTPPVVKQPVFDVPKVSYSELLSFLSDANTWAYEYAVNDSTYCTLVNFTDGCYQYIWSSGSLVASDGTLEYPFGSPSVFVSSDGMKVAFTWINDASWTTYESVVIDYISTYNVQLDPEIEYKTEIIEYIPEWHGGPDLDGDGDDDQFTYIYIPPGLEDILDLDKDDIFVDVPSAPDIVVDVDTGNIIMENGEIRLGMGQYVNIDANAAIASILTALGVSPDSADDDFDSLVSQIVQELPSDLISNYESVLNGNYTLMTAWYYYGKYYVPLSTMQFIVDLLYNGSDTMDPIFQYGELSPDLDKWPEYLTYVPESYRNNTTYNYLAAVRSDYTVWFILSENPISRTLVGYYFEFTTTGISIGWVDSYPLGSSNSSSETKTYLSLYRASLLSYNSYNRGVSIVGDLLVSGLCNDITQMDYEPLTVMDGDVQVFMYPFTLYSSVDDAVSGGQEGAQSGAGSDPSIVVDPETGAVIGGSVSDSPPDVEPDPTVDPTPDSDFDPSGDDTDIDGSETTDSSGSVTQTGLRGLLYEWGAWLADILIAPFTWLGSYLSKAYNSGISWLSSSLLNGWEKMIVWLKTNVVDGVGGILTDLFVPSPDLLNSKVEALRERFAFVDGVIATVEELQAIFVDYAGDSDSLTPPAIYVNLSYANSGIWGTERVLFVDFSWYARYKSRVDMLLSGCMWAFFVWRVFMRLPGIIGGESGDSLLIHIPSGRSKSNETGLRRTDE